MKCVVWMLSVFKTKITMYIVLKNSLVSPFPNSPIMLTTTVPIALERQLPENHLEPCFLSEAREWLPRSKRKGMVSVGDLKGDCSLPTYQSERWWLWQASGQSWSSGLLPKFITPSRWWLSYRIKLSVTDSVLECVLEVQLSIRVLLLKMPVLETSGISAMGVLISFTFLILV